MHNAITGASGRESVRSTAAALLDLNRVSPNKEDFVLAAGMHLVMVSAALFYLHEKN